MLPSPGHYFHNTFHEDWMLLLPGSIHLLLAVNWHQSKEVDVVNLLFTCDTMRLWLVKFTWRDTLLKLFWDQIEDVMHWTKQRAATFEKTTVISCRVPIVDAVRPFSVLTRGGRIMLQYLYVVLKKIYYSRAETLLLCLPSKDTRKTSQVSWVSQSAPNTDVCATPAVLPYCEREFIPLKLIATSHPVWCQCTQ